MSDFLNWELTNKMHNLGYNGGTLMYIDDEEDIINDDTDELIGGKNEFWKPAILTSAAFRWFRERHKLFATFWFNILTYNYRCNEIVNLEDCGFVYDSIDDDFCEYSTYKEAELATLEKLIEIVESKKE